MNQFNNRIDAQRSVLNIVNAKSSSEPLFGLSRKAIERWLHVNKMDDSNELVILLYRISSKLFFLASKSQQQITDEYRVLTDEVQSLIDSLKNLQKRSGDF